MSIEKYLVLNKYLLSLFGASDFKDLQPKLKGKEGFDPDGRSYFINVLRSQEGLRTDKISEDELLNYDNNISRYLDYINYRREPKVTLKYFQFFALLLTEIFLDNLKNRKDELVYELNSFLTDYRKNESIKHIDGFTDKDLNKIAFWMATGSGKTLISHINYHQFFHYKLFSPDNILYITPNERLSKQHFEELQKSSIPCRVYEGNLNASTRIVGQPEVLILEITKFVKEKSGGGVTLPVGAFEGKNLLFVDEGHKGTHSEEQTWRYYREALAKDGFTFEYSATFAQILGEKEKELLNEYGKAIIFDYSYKYFYSDGYGKDFSVLNIAGCDITEKEFRDKMFVANLLSYYEQLLVYEEHQKMAKEHNIEKPLWIFVGTTVTGKKEESDVVQIVKLFKQALEDKDWVQKEANQILKANTGIKQENGEDIFEQKFEYLKNSGLNLQNIYEKIFGGNGSFGVYKLKNAEGELGIKVGENDYFGVINIGDISGFKKELGKEGLTIGEDAIRESLFDSIKEENSNINVLMGAKKFIDGWDTWRVSSMGLLNIGTGQGPQIIQLFGRGVRLKGKGFSLKRTEEKSPVNFLEMLNIYGIRADYLNTFLDKIRREEVEFETIEIPIKPQYTEKWKSLYTLTKDENKKFEEKETLRFQPEPQTKAYMNLLPKITMYEGKEMAEVSSETVGSTLPEDAIGLLDWDRILNEIYEYKMAKGYWNLIFDKEALENLLASDRYEIYALSELEVKSSEDIGKLEEIAILVLKKYIDLFYRKHKKRFETENMDYKKVGKQLVLFPLEETKGKYAYTIQVEKNKKKLIGEIKELAKNFAQLCKTEEKTLPRIYFNRALYVPILAESKKIRKIFPEGLVKSEKDFILALHKYLRINKDKFHNKEIYLTRNFAKSGVGFFNLSGFYPDFVMWLKEPNEQTIIFLDPKGLEHTKGLDDQKIELAKDIKKLEKNIGRNDITLESFIFSQTSYDKFVENQKNPTSKQEFNKHHVLFLKDKDWPAQLFSYVK